MRIVPLLLLVFASVRAASDYFKITVIDDQTRRGVPLVELETTNKLRFYTDSNGIIAFYEPGLLDQDVYFRVRSHGYEFRDGLRDRGRKLRVTRGGSVVLKIRRLNIAERLYRVTGEGIYRDSILAGSPVPVRNPLLNGKVVGQDTVVAVPYRGEIYWFWGDTHGPADLNLAVSGATSEWPGKGGLDPSAGIDLKYFVDPSGFSKSMCPIPAPGLKWLEGLMTIKDERGRERLVARYASMKDLEYANEWGLAIFNDDTQVFERLVKFGIHGPHRSAHPFRINVGGEDYYYIFPNLRVKAHLEQLKNLSAYEAFTPLRAGSRYDRKAAPELDRDANGRLRYAWKPSTDPVHEPAGLIKAGHIKPDEAWLRLFDIETGAPVGASASSVFWNDFRKRWIMLAEGSGQVWYSEGDTPLGPWVYARKIVTHERYSFYNVTQHPFFDQDGGRLIYFEGTYSDTFSGSPEKTPRYDYNQIMYRLAVDDPRLVMPAPVYRTRDGRYLLRDGVDAQHLWNDIEEIPFFAFSGGRRHNETMSISGFYALPVASRPDLTGRWNCKLKEAGDSGDPLNLVFDLKQQGGEIQGDAEDAVITKGSFRNGTLALDVRDDRDQYVLTAKVRGDKLAGAWTKTGTAGRGVWQCDRAAPLPRSSPAVVWLYQHRSRTGELIYSTVPQQDDARPIGRVWQNPMSLLILDRDARPGAR